MGRLYAMTRDKDCLLLNGNYQVLHGLYNKTGEKFNRQLKLLLVSLRNNQDTKLEQDCFP